MAATRKPDGICRTSVDPASEPGAACEAGARLGVGGDAIVAWLERHLGLYIVDDLTGLFDPEGLPGALRRAREVSHRGVRTAWVPGETLRLIARSERGGTFKVFDATEEERAVIAAVEAEPRPPSTERGVRFLTANSTGTTMAAELCCAGR